MVEISQRKHGRQTDAAREAEFGKDNFARRQAKNQTCKARNANRRERRRKEAEARQESWDRLSTAEKLMSLDRRPGRSAKQRRKLMGTDR